MPKLELKSVQRELEQGVLWPFYWVYGPEKLKSRELLKRIRTAVSPQTEAGSAWGWGEEIFDGNEVDSATLVDSAHSPSLGGGLKLIVVRDAHALKNMEQLGELFGPSHKMTGSSSPPWSSVCVFLSKDLDGRKKFSKTLVDKAAVVSCEEVVEAQRESWIQYLAKRRGLELNSSLVMKLSALDPWSLDIVEQELEKLSVAGLTADVILEGEGIHLGSDAFLNSFFSRDLESTLPLVTHFAEFPDESLPLLGLLGWNVRQLIILNLDRQRGTQYLKLSPFVMDRLKKWNSHWKLSELIEIQKKLSDIDFSSKQTPLLPLGLWSDLVIEFCH